MSRTSNLLANGHGPTRPINAKTRPQQRLKDLSNLPGLLHKPLTSAGKLACRPLARGWQKEDNALILTLINEPEKYERKKRSAKRDIHSL